MSVWRSVNAPLIAPARRRAPRLARAFALLSGAVLLMMGLAAIGYRNALEPPLERHLRVEVPPSPGAPRSFKLVLFSDVHVHGPDMPPARLERIVAQINSQRPDLVVAAGDFVGDNWIGAEYPIGEAVAPLAGLRARLGVFAVLGNNDHVAGRKKVIDALSRARVRVLNDEAVRAGPIVLGGVDDRLDWRRSGSRAATIASMEQMPGLKVLVAHSPDVFPSVPPSISLVLAGHTHCGQIAVPLFGPLLTGSQYGRRFACGIYRQDNRLLVVTGGLGTSHVPIRFAAPPDFWVIEIQPARS
jgi:uncharacterized protein